MTASNLSLCQLGILSFMAAQAWASPLEVLDSADNTGTYAVQTGAPVTFTITFNGDIDRSTVSTDDFANAGTAPVMIGTISETSPGVLTVPLTATDAGTLRLRIPAGASLADPSGDLLDTDADIVLGDRLVPVYVPSDGLPVFVGSSPVATNVGNSITMAMPADAAPGDVLVACVVNYASGGTGDVSNAGTDWVLMKGASMAGETRNRIEVYHREVIENDDSTFTLGLGGTAPYSAGGIILAFRNMDKTDKYNAPFSGSGPSSIASGATPSTSATEISAVYVNQANSLVVLLGVAVADHAINWSNWYFRSSRTDYIIGAPEEVVDTAASSGAHTFSFGAANTIFEAPDKLTGYGNANLSAEAHSAGIQFQFKAGSNTQLYDALTELKAHVTGEAPLSDTQIAAHKETIVANRFSFSSSINSIAAAIDLVHTYDEVLGPLWVARPLPRRDQLVDDIHYSVFNVMQYLMDRSYTSANLSKHYDLLNGFAYGSAVRFPGACPPPADPTAVHSVQIDANYLDTWGRRVFGESLGTPTPRPTGTYLAPGSVATVTVPPALVGRGYSIRVGAHNWDFEEKPKLERLDRCAISYPILSTTTQVANPLGGGIYIEVPQYVSDVGVVTVQIQNAVRSPLYSSKSFRQTSLAEWRNTERHHPAPWADFQSEKFMMQVPTDWIYALDDPVSLMADWDHAVDVLNDFMGFPRDRGRETIYHQVDLMLQAAAYAPGYPAVNNHYNPSSNYGGSANNYLVRGPQYAPDYEFHELGHAYLFPKFPGEVESDVNLLHVAVMQGFGYGIEEAFRSSRTGSEFVTLETTAVAWMMCDNFLNGNIMEDFEKQYAFKGHAKFVEIARLFGWERLSNYFLSFNEDYENGITPVEEVDSLLLRLSGRVGIDVRPLFHFWGVPPENAAALESSIQAANLPKSGLLYDTLVHYKARIPANNAAFQTFALGWWGRQPSSGGYSEERNHASRWDNYDEAMAAATADRAQQIIDLYFPGGRPSDYGDWRSQWAGADLLDPQDDLDEDGMSNDDERVWGLDPTNPGSRSPLQFNIGITSNSLDYILHYTRRAPSLTRRNFTVWTSTDLKEWREDTGAAQLPGPADLNHVQTVETILSPELLSNPRLFIKIEEKE